MKKHILTWDLGATKCAAGLIEYDIVSQNLVCLKHYAIKLTQTHSLSDLIHQLETALDFKMAAADAICIAAAGHFDGEYLWHENPYPFPMHFAKCAADLNWPAYTVIHDYSPIVCATFTSYMQEAGNVKWLNKCDMPIAGRRVALGIGTGLGLKDGVLLPNGDFWLGKNEIGHIGLTMPPLVENRYLQCHHELIHFLQLDAKKHLNQQITFEKILSGQGTARLHQFFYPDAGVTTPEEAGEAMRLGKSPAVTAAFAWYTGLFIGAVQLSFMPESGVWITGGVALSNLAIFDHPDFYAGIHASPAYLSQRETYPLGILCNQQHALIGSAYYAAKRLLRD